MWKIFYVTLLLLLFYVASATDYNYQSDRVLLTDIKALTLRRGHKTTGRRTSPVDQLFCIGGSASGSNHQPDVVQCTNAGHDGFDVQWDCKADLESDVKFGSLSVTCEGYDSPSDPYVLKGSCGLEYNLEYTKKGQGNQYAYNDYNGDGSYYDTYNYQEGRSGWSNFFTFIVLVVVIYLVLRACASSTGNTPYGGGGGGYGTGYGGGPGGGGGPVMALIIILVVPQVMVILAIQVEDLEEEEGFGLG